MSNIDAEAPLMIIGRYATSPVPEIELSGTPEAYKKLAKIINDLEEFTQIKLTVPDLKTVHPYAGFFSSIAIKVDETKPELNMFQDADEFIIAGSKANQLELAKNFLYLAESEIRTGRLKTHTHIEYIPDISDTYLVPTATPLVATVVADLEAE